MAISEVVFDWEYVGVAGYGRIFRPLIAISLFTAKSMWEPFDFLVDSGADVSMLPFGMVEVLGLQLDKKNETESRGIGGFKVKTWRVKIPIRIGEWELEIPAVVTSDNLTPLILGRLGTLDREFSWIFDHEKRKIVFRKKK